MFSSTKETILQMRRIADYCQPVDAGEGPRQRRASSLSAAADLGFIQGLQEIHGGRLVPMTLAMGRFVSNR